MKCNGVRIIIAYCVYSYEIITNSIGFYIISGNIIKCTNIVITVNIKPETAFKNTSCYV